ncbi:MAG: Nif3-like dinuclear metal center hexameric protein [Clostridia bacterium]|nr:Nif3-like dinuclear metal center hexameric protein [Clostridia bacterium]
MKLREIAECIEKSFPKFFAMDRDNVGLIVGDENKDVNKILVCCDVDEYVAKEAADKGVDMIISHHPLMFFAIKHLNEDNPEQRALRILIKNDICLYTAHTNLDVGSGGINDYMAELLGLTDTEIIEYVCEYEGKKHGYGRFSVLKDETTLKDMLDRCKRIFNLDGCRYVGELDDKIRTVAINTGGGAGIMDLCFDLKADLFITGDVKYNPARDAYERGMDIIDIAHYDTEKITMDFFVKFFENKMPELQIIKSKANKRIYKIYA